jgi:hypothetical protein
VISKQHLWVPAWLEQFLKQKVIQFMKSSFAKQGDYYGLVLILFFLKTRIGNSLILKFPKKPEIGGY